MTIRSSLMLLTTGGLLLLPLDGMSAVVDEAYRIDTQSLLLLLTLVIILGGLALATLDIRYRNAPRIDDDAPGIDSAAVTHRTTRHPLEADLEAQQAPAQTELPNLAGTPEPIGATGPRHAVVCPAALPLTGEQAPGQPGRATCVSHDP